MIGTLVVVFSSNYTTSCWQEVTHYKILYQEKHPTTLVSKIRLVMREYKVSWEMIERKIIPYWAFGRCVVSLWHNQPCIAACCPSICLRRWWKFSFSMVAQHHFISKWMQPCFEKFQFMKLKNAILGTIIFCWNESIIIKNWLGNWSPTLIPANLNWSTGFEFVIWSTV